MMNIDEFWDYIKFKDQGRRRFSLTGRNKGYHYLKRVWEEEYEC
jgi:hypothetical protein